MNGLRFCSGHNQRNFVSITGLQKRLRAFLKPFFHDWSRDGKQLFFRSNPFRENGTAERPQTLRCPKIINNLSAKNAQQRRRPPPVAETGRSCWGSGQQDASAAQGTTRMLGAATRKTRRAFKSLYPQKGRRITSGRSVIPPRPCGWPSWWRCAPRCGCRRTFPRSRTLPCLPAQPAGCFPAQGKLGWWGSP